MKHVFPLLFMMTLLVCCSTPEPPDNLIDTIHLMDLFETARIEPLQKIIDLMDSNSFDNLSAKGIQQVPEGVRFESDRSDFRISLAEHEIRNCLLRLSIQTGYRIPFSILWNGNRLMINPFSSETDPGVYEFVLPEEVQRTSSNTIVISGIDPGSVMTDCRLLFGAVLNGFGAVSDEIHPSLLLIPEVKISYSFVVPENGVLNFQAGIDDRGAKSGSDGSELSITVLHKKKSIELFKKYYEAKTRQWHPETIDLKLFAGETIRLTVEARCAGGSPDGDILLVSDAEVISGSASYEEPQTDRHAHDIILVTLDATRADRLGMYGDHIIKTPVLDRLSMRGALFQSCYCQINNTPPSHYTILTSKRPKTHGVYDMVTPLSPAHTTLAGRLKPHGYHCAASVSAAWLSALTHGLGPGFDRFWAPSNAQRRGGVTFNAIKEWISMRCKSPSPYFVWLHLFDAHTPFDPPEKYRYFYYSGIPNDRSNHSMDKVGFAPEQVEYMKNWIHDVTDIDYLKAQYRSEITYMDSIIEDLYRTLSSSGRLERTCFIITADHGISLDEHDLFFIMAGMYEQQMHVPLFINLPGSAEKCGVFTNFVQSLDIAPTVLNMCGIDIPEDLEGRSLIPLIDGDSIKDLELIYGEHANNQAVMIREPNYKYVRYIRSPYYHEPERGLYNLQDDSRENNNLAGRNLSKETEMDLKIEEFLKLKSGHADLGAADSPELREKLKSLGYVE